VSNSTPVRSAEAAQRLGARAPAESAEALIASDDVDVVHICTPNVTHAALAEKAIAAGKSVVCEKPLATSVADADRLVALAEQAGVVAAVPFVYRYYPTVREVRARVADGDAGRLWLLHGSYLQDWLAGSAETNWRVDPAQGRRAPDPTPRLAAPRAGGRRRRLRHRPEQVERTAVRAVVAVGRHAAPPEVDGRPDARGDETRASTVSLVHTRDVPGTPCSVCTTTRRCARAGLRAPAGAGRATRAARPGCRRRPTRGRSPCPPGRRRTQPGRGGRDRTAR